MQIVDGASWLSAAMSPQLRCVAGVYVESLSSSSSPRWKKPKKAMVATAHMSILSWGDAASSLTRIALSIVIVIGSLIRCWQTEPKALARLMPACTLLRTGVMIGLEDPGDPSKPACCTMLTGMFGWTEGPAPCQPETPQSNTIFTLILGMGP